MALAITGAQLEQQATSCNQAHIVDHVRASMGVSIYQSRFCVRTSVNQTDPPAIMVSQPSDLYISSEFQDWDGSKMSPAAG